MDSAIVFSYSRPAPGREAKAFESFTEAQTFFGTQAHEGNCGEPLNFIATSGENLMIVPGEFEALHKLLRTDEFQDLYLKATYSTPDLGYRLGAFGAGAQESMARWARAGSELQLI